MINSADVKLRENAKIKLPTSRIGYVNPLDMIDTFPYEFYKVAPPHAIASIISIGLSGFSGDAARAAIEENLVRCLEKLAKRQVEFIVLGGLPMLFNLEIEYSEDFRNRCLSEYGIPAGTSIDAVLAAFKSLHAERVVMINKWDGRLNRRVADHLGAAGVNLCGVVAEEYSADQIKASFEEGADIALRLAESAVKSYPDADCLFIAGGAWLVAPYIAEIEREFGISVVPGQLSKIWYSLNVVGNELHRPEYGKLLDAPMHL